VNKNHSLDRHKCDTPNRRRTLTRKGILVGVTHSNYRQLHNDALSFAEIFRHLEGWEIILTLLFRMEIQLKNVDLLGGTAFMLVKSAVLEFCALCGTANGSKKMLWTDVQMHVTKEEQWPISRMVHTPHTHTPHTHTPHTHTTHTHTHHTHTPHTHTFEKQTAILYLMEKPLIKAQSLVTLFFRTNTEMLILGTISTNAEMVPKIPSCHYMFLM